MAETIFDKIIRREIPADVVFEDDIALAFKDINPQAPVHVLVIPKKSIQSFANLRDEDTAYVGEYIKRVSQVANLLGLEQDGYRVVYNHGKNGQQTVDHIHAHIIGGKGLKWPPG